MKNKFKIFIAVLITAIICISSTVYASYSYFAKDIGFTPKNKEWDVNNLEDAINDLYNKSKNNIHIISLYEGSSLEQHTIDIKEKYENYQKLTINNFYVKNVKIEWKTGNTARSEFPYLIKDYDSNTGILTLGAISARNGGYDYYMNYEVVLIY